MALGCAAAAQAHAEESFFQVEAGLGVDRYQTMGDGTWNQEGAIYNHVKLVFPAAQVGVRFHVYETADWGIAAHSDLVYLGNAQSDCWCTTNDSDYSPNTKQTAPGALTAHFVGHGNATGLALTIEPYLKRGAWRYGVEGGVFPFRPQWDEEVSHWANSPGMTPVTLYAHTTNRLRLGFLVGASVERGNFGLSLRHYFLQPFGTMPGSPPLYNTSTVLMATFHANVF